MRLGQLEGEVRCHYRTEDAGLGCQKFKRYGLEHVSNSLTYTDINGVWMCLGLFGFGCSSHCHTRWFAVFGHVSFKFRGMVWHLFLEANAFIWRGTKLFDLDLGVPRLPFGKLNQEGSGKAGNRYEHVEGDLIFPAGEFERSIRIPIIESPLWSATLEFKVILEHPIGCQSRDMISEVFVWCAPFFLSCLLIVEFKDILDRSIII